MSLVKSVLTAAAVTALLFLAVASVLAREKPHATQTNRYARKESGDRAAEELPGPTPAGYNEGLIRWMPIVVPLLAVLLALAVYLIDAAVL